MKPMTLNALKRTLAVSLLGVFASFGAHADDPVNGATLFSSNCTGSGCHNTATPLTSNATKIYTARNARAWIRQPNKSLIFTRPRSSRQEPGE